MNRTFLASLHELNSMLCFVEERAQTIGFKELQIAKILLAAEEALVNIISYGYPDTRGTIEIDCLNHSTGGIEMIIRDNGTPYNPLSNPRSIQFDPTLPIELRKSGGMGILIILRVMDCVTYRRENDQNVLTLVKDLN